MARIISTDTIRGSYGSWRTPCNVIIASMSDGTTWYAVEGSENVNCAPHELENGVWVEELEDVDMFTWSGGVDDEDELREAVEY